MKTYYAVHNDKTHVKVDSLADFVARFSTESDWKMVTTDSEGWIPHTGTECPLPGDVRCDIRCVDGSESSYGPLAANWMWPDETITHYRPILTEKVQETEPIPAPQYDPRSVSFNLLDRLKAAHEHAQTIPDLEAELREVLAGMGYDLVARSPFVYVPEAGFGNIAEPVAPVETPQDMSDWCNWREGDELKCCSDADDAFTPSYIYALVKRGVDLWLVDDDENYRPLTEKGAKHFRFHSRPAKGER